MVFALDTLSYAKHLRDHGVPAQQAEAHAEAARNFMMTELVNKQDLIAAKQELQATIDRANRRLMLSFAVMLLLSVGLIEALMHLS